MDLLKKMEKNRKQNSWWLNYFKKPLNALLDRLDFTPQAKGVFFNPYTSNEERLSMVKRFKDLKKE